MEDISLLNTHHEGCSSLTPISAHDVKFSMSLVLPPFPLLDVAVDVSEGARPLLHPVHSASLVDCTTFIIECADPMHVILPEAS